MHRARTLSGRLRRLWDGVNQTRAALTAKGFSVLSPCSKASSFSDLRTTFARFPKREKTP